MATAKRRRAANPNISLGSMQEALTEAASTMIPEESQDKSGNTPNTHNSLNTMYSENTSNTSDTSRPVGRPRTTVRNGPSKSNGLQPGLERYSLIMDSAQLDTLRDIAWNTRRTMKDLAAEAFGGLIANTPEEDKTPRPKK